MKASLQSQAMGDTAAHNDRTMYADGVWPGEGPTDPLPNWSLTQERDGIGTSEALQRFYDEHYLPVLRQKNANAAKNRNREPYDLSSPVGIAESLEKFRQRYPPRETILQVGERDNQLDPAASREILLSYINDVYIPEFDRMQDMHIIAADIHMEEATPHAHLVWIGNGPDGVPNTEATLATNDVQPPIPYDQYARDYLAKQVAENKRTGKPIKTVRESSTRGNNRLMTFTAMQREQFEGFVESRGVQLDTVRTRKPHLELAAYKAQQRREAAVKAEQQLIAEQNAAAEKVEQRVAQRRDSYKSVGEKLKAAAEALDAAGPGGVALDPEGREIDAEWLAETRSSIGGLQVRDSKKDRLVETLDTLSDSLKARNESLNLDARTAALDAREAKIADKESVWERDEKPKLVATAKAEGLQAGKDEADQIVTDARSTAKSITDTATTQASEELRQARKKIEKEKQDAEDARREQQRQIREHLDDYKEREKKKADKELTAYQEWARGEAEAIDEALEYERDAARDGMTAQLYEVMSVPDANGQVPLDYYQDLAEKSYDAKHGGQLGTADRVSREVALSETLAERHERFKAGRAARDAALKAGKQDLAQPGAAPGNDQDQERDHD